MMAKSVIVEESCQLKVSRAPPIRYLFLYLDLSTRSQTYSMPKLYFLRNLWSLRMMGREGLEYNFQLLLHVLQLRLESCTRQHWGINIILR